MTSAKPKVLFLALYFLVVTLMLARMCLGAGEGDPMAGLQCAPIAPPTPEIEIKDDGKGHCDFLTNGVVIASGTFNGRQKVQGTFADWEFFQMKPPELRRRTYEKRECIKTEKFVSGGWKEIRYRSHETIVYKGTNWCGKSGWVQEYLYETNKLMSTNPSELKEMTPRQKAEFSLGGHQHSTHVVLYTFPEVSSVERTIDFRDVETAVLTELFDGSVWTVLKDGMNHESNQVPEVTARKLTEPHH